MRATPELRIRRSHRKRLLDPIEPQALELGKNRVEVLRTHEALVEVDAHPEVWELLAQAFQRRQTCGTLRHRAVGAVHRFERRTLEDREALPADLAHDRRVLLGAAGLQ